MILYDIITLKFLGNLKVALTEMRPHMTFLHVHGKRIEIISTGCDAVNGKKI